MNRLVWALIVVAPLVAQDGREEFFETEIRPLFAERCAACHNAELRSGDLDLASAEDAQRVAASGSLLAVLTYDQAVKMPPTGKLPEDDIAAVRRWVGDGAVWPNVSAAASEGIHWAFQPIREPEVPGRPPWGRTEIDAFIADSLQRKQLEQATPASKRILLRRAKFDLHGLPPTVEEINAFLADDQDGAYERLVDRLLASPEYGERWGRHWLDVARYADSTGVDEDHPYPHAWRYRDYVVAAFNDDMPYDQFVREQIAGDLLHGDAAGAAQRRGIIATGFLGLGPKALAQRDPVQKKYDVVDEQIDTTAKTFLALTVACARCHDHKFDPVLTSDYYALASIFASTKSYEDWRKNGSESLSTPLVSAAEYRPFKEHRERISALERIRRTQRRLALEEFRLDELVPVVAERMLDARAAYTRDETPEDGLAAWVAFLRPRPDAPSYLKPWHDADAAGAERFAQEQQARLSGVLERRVAALRQWLPKAESQFRAGEKITVEMGELVEDSLYTGLVEDDAPFAIDDGEEVFGKETRKRLALLDEEIEALEKAAPPEPPTANAVAEGEPVAQKIFVRGSYKNEGDPVAKRFPIVLAGDAQTPIASGSGRRELAEWLVADDNPLTARVIVNRVWQWHFGEGLVRTPSNFGKVGERPTHPELLDYLARRLVESGWSIKQLHRLIMRSAVYRMSGHVSKAAWEKDAENRLWSRFPRRRLSIEELRDSYLALSGKLDRTMGGTLDEDSGEIPEFERNNRRLDPDDYTRRTLYIPLMRNKVPFLLGMFDFGDATTTMAQRSASNVAPQTLYLLNSEFAARSAEGFADRTSDAEDPVERAYLEAFGRRPTNTERDEADSFVARFRRGKEGWASFCKMLLASNEFHYVD